MKCNDDYKCFCHRTTETDTKQVCPKCANILKIEAKSSYESCPHSFKIKRHSKCKPND